MRPFELSDHQLDRRLAGVFLAVIRPGRIGGQPVRLAGLEALRCRLARFADEFHLTADERDDDAWMVVTVQGPRLAGRHHRLVDAHVLIPELRDLTGASGGWRLSPR